MKSNPMEFEIVERPSFCIMGISVWTINKDGIAGTDIYNLWQKWFQDGIADQIPARLSDDVYNLYCDFESDHSGRYRVILGNLVKSIERIPKGLTGRKFPKSKYAVYHLTGKLPYVVVETWNNIYQEKRFQRKYLVDFDIYDMNAYDPEMAKVDICVSVK
jgi:predicted transcriptional regulator YdeE